MSSKQTLTDALTDPDEDGIEVLLCSETDYLEDPFQFFTEWHSRADDEAFADLSSTRSD